MKLLIDVGNTRIKLGWVRNGLRESQSLALGHHEIDRLSDWLEQLATRPSAAIGVNVAGPYIAEAIDEIFTTQVNIETEWVHSQPQAAGVRNAYDHQQLGADRWVSMLGLATQITPGDDTPLLLASFGTTTTIDTLEPTGPSEIDTTAVFLGGLILPGPLLMTNSLATGTARLPVADSPAAAFPLHTHEAISSGIAAAQTGALLRQWREVLDRHGRAPRLFSSGGGWPLVESEMHRTVARAQADLGLAQQPIHWLPSPVLDGLAQLAVTA
ncbi:type III pantothenate kinase [Alcaligenaceae bacterium]|nr:type III pantothenate kinase [Alcaligenaceae bacterium]